jgi:hypothetical protein
MASAARSRAQAAAYAWGAACLLALAYALPRLDAGGHGAALLWTHFQPLPPPLLMLWCWSLTVRDFEAAGVPYAACFSERDRRRLPSAAALQRLAAWLTLLCLSGFAACALLCAATRGTIAAAPAPAAAAGGTATPAAAPPPPAPSPLPLLVPPLLYAALAATLLSPRGALRPARRLFVRTLGRVAMAGAAPVTWSDFLVADMLTSLAKSFGDAARAACLVLHGAARGRSACGAVCGEAVPATSVGFSPHLPPSHRPTHTPLLLDTGPWAHPASARGAVAHAVTCGPLSLQFLALLVLPFCLRLLQCLSVWRRGGASAQAANALKYLSSLPALVLTAMEHEAHKARWAGAVGPMLLRPWRQRAAPRWVQRQPSARGRHGAPRRRSPLLPLPRRRPFPLRRRWLCVMLANSLYSAFWDVEMDWGMPWLLQPGAADVKHGPRGLGAATAEAVRARLPNAADPMRASSKEPVAHPLHVPPPADALRVGPLRLPRPRRGGLFSPGWYAWLVACTLLLRFSWAHRLVGDLEAHDAVLMAVALLEVVRRWQWSYGRFEHELRQLGALPAAPGAPEATAPLAGAGDGGAGPAGAGKGPAPRAGGGGWDGDWLDRPSFGGGGASSTSQAAGGSGSGLAAGRLHAAAALWARRRGTGSWSGAGSSAAGGGDVESAVVSPAARSDGGSSSGSGSDSESGGEGGRGRGVPALAAAALAQLTERHPQPQAHAAAAGASDRRGRLHIATD